MRFLLVFALMFTAVAGFSAHACIGDSKDDQVNRQKKYFVRYDANHDARLSRDEYISSFKDWGINPQNADSKINFDKMDKDKSGFLTFEEWSALHPPEFFAADNACAGGS